MKPVAQNRWTTVYDIGSGARVAGVIVFVTTALIVIGIFVQNGTDELKQMPAYGIRHPIEGVVLSVGCALSLWCIWLGLWTPLRSLAFPSKVEGSFTTFNATEGKNGKSRIEISVDGLTIANTRYNPILVRSLEGLVAGERIRLLLGSGGFVTRIQRAVGASK